MSIRSVRLWQCTPLTATMAEVVDSPTRYLAKKAGTATRTDAELATAALLRLATTDSEGHVSEHHQVAVVDAEIDHLENRRLCHEPHHIKNEIDSQYQSGSRSVILEA
jgi:hypothetical protein